MSVVLVHLVLRLVGLIDGFGQEEDHEGDCIFDLESFNKRIISGLKVKKVMNCYRGVKMG